MSSTAADLESFLSSATISPSIFQLRPDYRAHLIAVSNLPPPGPSDPASEALLLSAESHARTLSSTRPVPEFPHIASWRSAFDSAKLQPKKNLSSLEMLTKRATAPGGLPRINKLTDIYNSVSVKHQIPFGGEDLAKYVGPPRLILAEGDERFETRAKGEDVVEHPKAGEVVWCDDEGVTCRRWNWRQGTRTALTESTREVLFILDLLDPVGEGELEEAVGELLGELRGLGEGLRVARRTIGKPEEG